MINKIYDYIQKLIFGNCIYCKKFINQLNALCHTCDNKLIKFISYKCIFCNMNTNPCLCINVSYHILYKYNRVISDIILRFKYNNEYYLSQFFANQFILNIKNINNSVLISIPTTYKKLQFRGYNQSVEMCKQISVLLNIPCEHFALKKTKTTNQQNKNQAERIHNASSIELNNIDNIRDKHIIIVDDVIASGATIMRCVYLLQPYVKSIQILAIAKSN